jgi:hypothetical protein
MKKLFLMANQKFLSHIMQNLAPGRPGVTRPQDGQALGSALLSLAPAFVVAVGGGFAVAGTDFMGCAAGKGGLAAVCKVEGLGIAPGLTGAGGWPGGDMVFGGTGGAIVGGRGGLADGVTAIFGLGGGVMGTGGLAGVGSNGTGCWETGAATTGAAGRLLWLGLGCSGALGGRSLEAVAPGGVPVRTGETGGTLGGGIR